MNKYECSTSHTPTVEIHAKTENEARRIYREDYLSDKKLTISVRYVGTVQEDSFSRFTR